jgi:hypothetical protein
MAALFSFPSATYRPRQIAIVVGIEDSVRVPYFPEAAEREISIGALADGFFFGSHTGFQSAGKATGDVCYYGRNLLPSSLACYGRETFHSAKGHLR